MSLSSSRSDLESKISTLGAELFRRIEGEVPGFFNRDYWQGRLLDWAMKDESFKVDMLRFVDVLPALESSSEVSAHIKEYFLKDNRELPAVIEYAVKAASFGITSGLSTVAIRKGVTEMAERFIIGKDPPSALKEIKNLHQDGFAFTADLLGEATVSDEEARVYQSRYVELMDELSTELSSLPSSEIISSNHLGPIPVANVSLKISAMDSQIDPLDPAGSVARLKTLILPILLRAKERNVFVNLDMEHWDFHDITYDLLEDIVSHPELKNWPHIGAVVQAYLKDSEKDVERLLSISKSRNVPITVRLVKGAYWDYEVIKARQNGWPCRVFTNKSSTDANYERLSAILVDNSDYLIPAFASHNHRSLLNALALAEQKGLPKNGCEIQMLYGMAEPERKALKGMGYRVRLYAPVGELLPGIGYLVRRLLENTSNQGFLRLSYREEVKKEELLSTPVKGVEIEDKPEMVKGDVLTPFENSPLTDFTEKAACDKFADAVKAKEENLPVKVPVSINGNERFSGETVKRFSPGNNSILVSEYAVPSIEEAERAVRSAYDAYPAWRDKPVKERALLLEKLADLLEAEREKISALQSFEVGKPWREADGDVAEAIDFCRYYARRAVKELSPQTQENIRGEKNELFFEGRGPALIVAPWNFPAAIFTGMATAALVAGNPVILKPSSNSCGVGYEVYKLMLKAGFPTNVVHFVPGAGESIGDYLATHPLIAQIAFTGSKDVGLSIIEKAARTVPGQPEIKRVVCEMGGKNAIIVDSDAEPDEAALAIIKSGFGYAGQKCSACSRVIIVGDYTYKNFTSRLIEACRSILIGAPHRQWSKLGPVVDEKAYNRLMAIRENPGEGAKVLFREDGAATDEGYYVPPALFEVDDINHPLMQNELFGPIVTLFKVNSFEEALCAALATEFKLTGGVFSRSPANLEKARQKFRVGNLYLNRGITGALVHRQPFGGFGMSGLGTKAGGPGYLYQFVEPRSVTENSMRRGFAPETD